MSNVLKIFSNFLKENAQILEEIEMQSVCLSNDIQKIDKNKEYPTLSLDPNKISDKALFAMQHENIHTFIKEKLLKENQINTDKMIKMVKTQFQGITSYQIKICIRELIEAGIVE